MTPTIPTNATRVEPVYGWAAVAPEDSIVRTGIVLSSINREEREAWRLAGWGTADETLEEVHARAGRDGWRVIRVQISPAGEREDTQS